MYQNLKCPVDGLLNMISGEENHTDAVTKNQN